jgi:hypothetical protein
MESRPHPSLSVPEGTFSLLIAPEALLLPVLERHLEASRCRALYICGNYSGFLSRLDRRCPDFAVRRAFTVHQLLAILGEADEGLIVIEHDGSLYDDGEDAAAHVGPACRDRARAATVILIATAVDPVIRRLSARADRVICIEEPDPSPAVPEPRRNSGLRRSPNQGRLEV